MFRCLANMALSHSCHKHPIERLNTARLAFRTHHRHVTAQIDDDVGSPGMWVPQRPR